MRYIDGMLPDRAFKKSLFKSAPQTLEGGSAPQQAAQPSQQTITNNPIADWAQPTASALIGSQMQNAYNIDANGNILSSRGFTPFGGQTNAQGQFTGAPVSQDQYNQQLQVAGLGVAGPSALQQQSYQGAANLQTPGAYGQAQQAAGYGAGQAFNMANNATPQDFQNQVGGYMNPYIQQSLAPQLAEMQRQYGITGAQQAGQATQSGAFGGGRDAIMAAENERNKNTAMNQVIAQGYNTAFNNAQNQYNQSGAFQLQANQAGVQNAGTQANIAGQGLQAQQGILGLQNQMGSQEQQNQQNVINQALQNYGNQQNYGTTQATNIMNLVRSTPTTQTQTMYQAPPSLTSQAAGVGTAGIAGYKLATMAGGGIAKVKKFDVGGSVENQLYKMPTDALGEEVKTTPSQTIKNTGNAILEERKLGTTPTPAYAPGGIVAFAEGGENDIIPVEVPEEEDMTGNPMGEFTMPSRIMSASTSTAPTAPATAPKAPINVFDKAMAFVLPHEGGFVHHKNDKGGATNRGITQKTLSEHLGRKATIDDVKNLDEETAREIYKNQFFNPIASKLDDPKAQMVAFNAAIASGPSYANKLIQKHDGNPYEMLKEHTNFMVNDIPKRDPSQKVFVKGWENRQNDLGKYIQDFAQGGIAHFEIGGKTKVPDYTDDVPYSPDAASQPAKEPYPGYESDKAMYEGIAKIPSKLLKVNPYSIGAGIGDSFRRGIDEPLDVQARNFRAASNRTAQAANPDKFVPPPVNMPVASTPIAKSLAKTSMTDEEYARLKAMNDTSGERRFAQSQVKPSVAPTSQPTATPDYTNDVPYSSDAASQPLSSAPEDQPQEGQGGGGKSSRDMIQQMLMDRMSKQGESAQQDKWMSLLSAGLGMMGGTSPYAAANIGQGAQQGIAAQMAAKRNQISEQNSTLTGMLGLERAHATDAYHQAQLAQNAQIRKDQLNEVIRSHTATEEEKRNALAELTRGHNIQDQNTDEARADRKRQFNMQVLGNMEKNAQAQVLSELKLNPMALMGKSAEEINALTAPRIQEILKGNKRYRDMYKTTYDGYDPFETTESPVNTKDRKPLTSFQK